MLKIALPAEALLSSAFANRGLGLAASALVERAPVNKGRARNVMDQASCQSCYPDKSICWLDKLSRVLELLVKLQTRWCGALQGRAHQVGRPPWSQGGSRQAEWLGKAV